MEGVQYRGYLIQALRKRGAFIVNIFPMNRVNAKSNRNALPGGRDQLIKLVDPGSGMYRTFFDVREAMKAGEKKVDSILKAVPAKESRYFF